MCENCKFYEKENDFVGKCDKIKMMVMVSFEPDELKEFESFADLKVRGEFKCNQFEEK